MRFRFRCFGIHFLLSAVLLTMALSVLYWGWYRWPNWYLAGADTVVGLMVLVDLGVGPLATLVVADPMKLRRKLLGDFAAIVLVQLAALGLGLHALWAGRPLYYVFSGSGMDLVPASAILLEDVELARLRGSAFQPTWRMRPIWVWAPLPQDPEELRSLLVGRLIFGGDVATMPQYFLPWESAKETLKQHYRAVPVASGWAHQETPRGWNFPLVPLGEPTSEPGALPIHGSAREGIIVFDRESGLPLKFLRLANPDAK